MSAQDLFDIGGSDTVWDAWLTTVSLLDCLECSPELSNHFDFADSRNKIAKIYSVAESHSIDRDDVCCLCGLTDAEHAILRRKIMTFFSLQIGILKHFVH